MFRKLRLFFLDRRLTRLLLKWGVYVNTKDPRQKPVFYKMKAVIEKINKLEGHVDDNTGMSTEDL